MPTLDATAEVSATIPDSTLGSKTWSHALKTLLTIFGGLIVAFGIYALWTMEPTVVTISEGRVYKSPTLPTGELLEVVKERGIHTVIDLRENLDDVAAEGAALATVGVKHISLPTPQVPSDETVASFLNVLDDETTYPVLIHCRHGEGRAVLFSSVYRMEYENWDNESARHATRPAWRLPFSSFDLDEPKGAFVGAYVPRKDKHPLEASATVKQ